MSKIQKRAGKEFSLKQFDESQWGILYDEIVKNIDLFSEKLGGGQNENDLMRRIENFVIPVARNGFANQERKQKLFYDCEKFGVHILPTHFYSPIPAVEELDDRVWDMPFSETPVNFNRENCFGLLTQLKKYKDELENIPYDKVKDGEFYWNNPAILGTDVSIYYEMIRHFKPSKLVEIGSGYSTLIAAKAVLNNQGSTLFEAIEPYPFEFLKKGISGLDRLMESKVQDVPLEYFDSLQAGDILFVDNSHVSKAGSDVNHIMLRVLPRLKSGVIIHFHDIMLPYEMPKQWIREKVIFWNEEYLLQALLLGGDRYESLIPVHYLGVCFPEKLEEVTANRMEVYGGGSYWIWKH